MATALEYALGYSDLAVVGALELLWPVGGQDSDGRLVVLLAVLWGDPMYASPERKSKGAWATISILVPAGPSTTVELSTVHARLRASGARESVSGGYERSPRLQGAKWSVTPERVRQGRSVELLVWAVPLLSSGIMRQARRWALLIQRPGDLPPSNGILMGLQSGLPTKRLCVPRKGRRAVAREPHRVGGGSVAWKFLSCPGFTGRCLVGSCCLCDGFICLCSVCSLRVRILD